MYPAGHGPWERFSPVKDAKAAELAGAVAHDPWSTACTSEAIYTDDIPQPPGATQAALICG
jgi:hypothetical protein